MIAFPAMEEHLLQRTPDREKDIDFFRDKERPKLHLAQYRARKRRQLLCCCKQIVDHGVIDP
jgi:hypothetical protein